MKFVITVDGDLDPQTAPDVLAQLARFAVHHAGPEPLRGTVSDAHGAVEQARWEIRRCTNDEN